MAEHAYSTGLPATAPYRWRELWTDIINVHDDGRRAVEIAFAAGVDRDDLCLIQLASPKDRHHVMPRLWFGPDHLSPCRVFSPTGEVGTETRPGVPLVVGTVDAATGECHFNERWVK